MPNTKEQIMRSALKLFSQSGYEAVSTSCIAGELGITKGALYRHYADKRAIFDAILARMAEQDTEKALAHYLPPNRRETQPEAYTPAAWEQLFDFSRAMFRYWTEDPFAADFRKMLTIEQYRSPEMGALYQQYLSGGPMGYVADLLESGGLSHPREKAAALYAVQFFLYSLADGGEMSSDALDALLLRHLETLRTQWHNELQKQQ